MTLTPDEKVLRKREIHKKWRDQNPERTKAYHARNREKRHPLLPRYKGMLRRCLNPKCLDYPRYGGRGITVCERWLGDAGFVNFVADMYPSWEKGLTLDRENNNKGYDPENCKWSSAKEQANNTRHKLEYKLSFPESSPINIKERLTTLSEFSDFYRIPLIIVTYRYAQHAIESWILDSDVDNRHYEYRGQKYNLTELSLIAGINYNTMKKRVQILDWSINECIEVPVKT